MNLLTSNWEFHCGKVVEGVWTFNQKTERWLLLTENSSPMSQRFLTPAVAWKDYWGALVRLLGTKEIRSMLTYRSLSTDRLEASQFCFIDDFMLK